MQRRRLVLPLLSNTMIVVIVDEIIRLGKMDDDDGEGKQ